MAAILQLQSRRVFRVIDPSPRSFPKMTSISRQSSGPLDYSSRNQCRLIFFSFKFDASFTQLRAKHKCIFPLKMSNPQNFLFIYGHILFLMPLSLRYIQPATMYIEHTTFNILACRMKIQVEKQKPVVQYLMRCF